MLKMHYFVGGAATVIQEVAEPFAIAQNTTYDFKIVTSGSTITTYLKHTTDSDWTLANTLTDTHFSSGGIGFRTGSTEQAKFGDLLMQSPSGANSATPIATFIAHLPPLASPSADSSRFRSMRGLAFAFSRDSRAPFATRAACARAFC